MFKQRYSNKKLSNIFGLTIFLCLSFYIILKQLFLTGEVKNNLSENNHVEIFSDSKGTPLLATGSCKNNSDCIQTGCSSQICANHKLTTTCELGKFPEKETYKCGCLENQCVWFR